VREREREKKSSEPKKRGSEGKE
jgi:hypothetical protein